MRYCITCHKNQDFHHETHEKCDNKMMIDSLTSIVKKNLKQDGQDIQDKTK
jgi:hypothetical protein